MMREVPCDLKTEAPATSLDVSAFQILTLVSLIMVSPTNLCQADNGALLNNT